MSHLIESSTNLLNTFCINIAIVTWFIKFIFESFITYVTTDFITDIKDLTWVANFIIKWCELNSSTNLWYGLIQDEFALFWLYKNGTLLDYFTWNYYTIYFIYLKDLVDFFHESNLATSAYITVNLPTFVAEVLYFFFKSGVSFVILLHFILYTKTFVKGYIGGNTQLLAKISYFVESEEELGSLDDVLIFIIFFIVVFSWFFTLILFFPSIYLTSLNCIGFALLFLVVSVLLIPTGVLIDFGISYTSYIRGAGSSSSLFVEIIFDLIGTLVVFTRFIVQNIRFVLVSWAYFELFEWIYNSAAINLFLNLFNFNFQTSFEALITNPTSGYYHFFLIILGIINYFYYFLHLLILLFIQLGAYFLISFWLFFFFYTSFFLTKQEKLFFYKRYYNN